MNSSKIKSDMYFFHNVRAPGNFLVARNLSHVLNLCSVFMHVCFSIIIFKALGRANNQRSKIKQHTLKLMLSTTVCAALTCLWCLSMTIPEGVHPDACSRFGNLGGIFYSMSNFFVYCILLKRAESTFQESSNRLFTSLFVLVKLGTALVPVAAVGTIFAFQGKIYFSEEFCVQQADANLTWFATCLDSTLSFGYLLLFLLPVLGHVHLIASGSVAPSQHTGSASRSAKIKTTAKRNLEVSSVAICSTFIYLTGISLVSGFTLGDGMALVPYLHWQNWTLYGAAFDLSINSVCIMIMLKGLWTTEDKNAYAASGKGKAAKHTDMKTGSVFGDAYGYSTKGREPLFPDDSEAQ